MTISKTFKRRLGNRHFLLVANRLEVLPERVERRQKMGNKPSFDSVSALWKELSPEEQFAFVESDNRSEIKAFLRELAVRAVENIFIAPISDKDLSEELRAVAAKWRKLAAELGYAGPVAWKVRAGFTLKQHAPKTGPCEQNFAYLQDWRLRNDEPTKDSVVFWIPRILPGSTAKTADEQMNLLADLRRKHDLPATHLASFGSAALLAGLVLAHFKITGERVPLDCYWTRTDTLHADGRRLNLGFFAAHGLRCARYDWDDDRRDGLGCFALGV